MEPKGKHRPFSCFHLLVFFFSLSLVLSQQLDSFTEKMTFYPASLMVSHSPKPLTFYDNTKLLNIHTVLNFTDFGKHFSMSNNSCSILKQKFFDELLETVRRFQKVARRLLSLPGFSTLIECDTYLPRYFQYLVGQPSKMSCPRAYRNSVSECKSWALRYCRGFSVDERRWLQTKDRSRRSNWMCHAGVFGLFRAIYRSTGHKCEPNHVSNLKETLSQLTRAMRLSQHLVRVVDGKVVYLFKIADQFNSKLDVLGQNLKRVDNTFADWQSQLKTFSNSIRCHESMTMDFLSKYSAEVNRAFAAFLRLFEIQDTLNQVSQLNRKTLVGYSDLPKFISSHLSAKLLIDPSLQLAIRALEEGLSVLASPMVDVEHDGRDLNVNILLLVPEIASKENFCVIEHLTPLKFNLSHTCFTGPVRQTNLALITCPNSQKIISLEALDRCFSSEVGFLCPTNVLKTVSSLQWLGFAWNPELKLSFPRNHLPAPNCDHIQPFVHLGGRYFLSTTSGTVVTNTGYLDITPLAIYNFPCNISFVGMKTSLATCPKSLSISLPLFAVDSIVYVQWDPNSDDMSPLQLHHESLSAPPPVVINRTVLNEFDELFQYYDSQLSSAIDKADDMVNQIEVTSETTLTDYIAYAAFGLSVLNFILCCITCQCLRKIFQHHLNKAPQQSVPLQTVPITPSPHKICKRCDKPVKQEHQSPKSPRVRRAHNHEGTRP